MKKTLVIVMGLTGILSLSPVVTEQIYHQDNRVEAASEEIPEGMELDREVYEAWKIEEDRLVFPFLKTEFFDVEVLPNQDDIKHKMGIFCFKEEDENRAYENAEFYYCVEAQQVVYAGLKVTKKKRFQSEDFREACIRLMMGYNASYDTETKESTPNLSRERAEEIVDYCIENQARCVVDDMRITVLADADRKDYRFHMEY